MGMPAVLGGPFDVGASCFDVNFLNALNILLVATFRYILQPNEHSRSVVHFNSLAFGSYDFDKMH